MKLCRRCGEGKPLDAFHADASRKDGRVSYCIPCAAAKRSEYYRANTERLKAASREYHAQNNRTEEKKAKRRAYHKSRVKDLAARRVSHARRYADDPLYRMQHIMRAMMRRHIRIACGDKIGTTQQAFGYTPAQLSARMETQFKPGMSWSNYGEWEIDHKVPLSRMLAKGEARPHVVNALANLQPMWKFDNRSKGARRVG